MKINLDVENLTENQAKDILITISENLQSFIKENAESDPLPTLEGIIEMLDNMDDFFGTEGWRHTFGFED